MRVITPRSVTISSIEPYGCVNFLLGLSSKTGLFVYLSQYKPGSGEQALRTPGRVIGERFRAGHTEKAEQLERIAAR